MWHSITKWMDYNRNLLAGLVLAIVMAAVMLGCSITTDSLVTPGTTVTSTQLQVEISATAAEFVKREAALEADMEVFNYRAEIAKEDIVQKTARREKLINMIAGFGAMVAEGGINPAAAIGAATQLALLLAGTGAVLDNRRKDAIIREGNATPSAT